MYWPPQEAIHPGQENNPHSGQPNSMPADSGPHNITKTCFPIARLFSLPYSRRLRLRVLSVWDEPVSRIDSQATHVLQNDQRILSRILLRSTWFQPNLYQSDVRWYETDFEIIKAHLHITSAFAFFFNLCSPVLENANFKCEHHHLLP